MRKWAHLKQDPLSLEDKPFVRIMLFTSAKGTYVFLYDSEDSVFCTADEWYETEEEALDRWEDEIDPEGWHVIDDPLPGCQQDSVLPIRVKGRDEGTPQWGEYEILKDGEWVDFTDHQ